MRTALTALGLAAAIAASWCAPLAAQTKEPYGGPGSVRFWANGGLAPTQGRSVDLTTGAADVAGRHLTLAPPDLAKLRSLAIEVRAKGLFDTACIERQRKEAELANLRQKEEAEKKQAEWKRQHPGDKGAAPIFIPPPPLDPYWAFLQVEGVGTVEWAPEFGNQKSDARCVTPATKTLWDMVMGL